MRVDGWTDIGMYKPTEGPPPNPNWQKKIRTYLWVLLAHTDRWTDKKRDR